MTSDSENQYIDANGVRYVAQEANGCNFCAFERDGSECNQADPCSKYGRRDNRSIIWIKA